MNPQRTPMAASWVQRTVQASSLEEHVYLPRTTGQPCLCALLGGFLPKRPRFSAYCKCSSGWQTSQRSDSSMQCIMFSEKVPCLVQFSSPPQLASLVPYCCSLGVVFPNVVLPLEDSKPCTARSLSLLPPRGGQERRTGDTKGKDHGLR